MRAGLRISDHELLPQEDGTQHGRHLQRDETKEAEPEDEGGRARAQGLEGLPQESQGEQKGHRPSPW
jgi:hypothetical protein